MCCGIQNRVQLLFETQLKRLGFVAEVDTGTFLLKRCGDEMIVCVILRNIIVIWRQYMRTD